MPCINHRPSVTHYFAAPLLLDSLLPANTPPRVTNCAANTVRITPEMFSVAAPGAPFASSLEIVTSLACASASATAAAIPGSISTCR